MVTAEQKTIKVAAVGLDERAISRMATIFKISYRGRCEIAQIEDANLAIVDLDSEANVWEKYQQQHPGMPTIVMSEALAEVEGATYVAKPAKLDLLWNAVVNLMIGLPQESETTDKTDSVKSPSSTDNSAPSTKSDSKKLNVSTAASAINTQFKTADTGSRAVQRTTHQDDASLFYNPDEYLLGHILSSLKDNTSNQNVIHVQCWRDQRLILLPNKGLALTDLKDSQLKSLGAAKANETFDVKISTSEKELSASEMNGLKSISIDHLIWDLALRTARGHVPEGTELSQPLYLRCWPNFPRLPRRPHDMRISSLWVDNPMTLDDLAHNLGIDRADVYSFYSAAVAIGLAGPAKRQADSLVVTKQVAKEKPTKRGLLTSILRHISK